MAWINTPDPDGSDADLAALYARVADPETGRVDNIMRIHALHPAGMRAHFELYSAVMAGTPTFRKVDREMVALVVSRANDCHY